MRPAEGRTANSGLLFVPVSGGDGTGELQRARLLALAARARWPQLAVGVIAAAATLARMEWPAGIDRIELPGSPTKHSAEVMAAIRSRRPAVVLFDSTARPAQLAAARAIGAAVVYLSSRPSARGRGFKLRAWRRIDEHWSVEISLQRLPSAWQRLLLRLPGASAWIPLGTLFEPADAIGWSAELRQFVDAGDYLLACPGGGTPQGAALYANASEQLAREGVRTLLVRGDWPAGRSAASPGLLQVGVLPNAQLMALLAGARLALLGGGSVLVQALALEVPCVAAALAEDQAQRLAVLAQAGAVTAAAADSSALRAQALPLWQDVQRRAALRTGARALGLRNGLDLALSRLDALTRRAPTGASTR